MTEVLVFSPHRTPRFLYTLHWVLTCRLGLEPTITDSEQEFESSTLPRINYSSLQVANCFNIEAGTLLFDTAINENFGEIGNYKGLKTLFHASRGELPFDIFGAVFYCLSRMEEYGANSVDTHGRFLHTGSILYKLGVLDTPIVDLWVAEFKTELKAFYPMLECNPESYKFLNTLDIDQAFCYKEKGWKRNMGGLLRDLLSARFKDALMRLKVLLNKAPDPFDTFEYILKLHNERKLKSVVFLLLADYGAYDKNVNYQNPAFQNRMKQLQEKMSLGIHPSYFSFNDLALMRKQIKRLVEFQKMPVAQSRQHYLRFNLPITFQNLIEAGIRHEYSMGYAETIGFRAGTAHAFRWFDLSANEVSVLELHPFCVMDVTLKNYMQLSPQQAINTIQILINKVKNVNGTFAAIWHNETISNWGEWEGWRTVYEQSLPNIS